MTYVYLLSESGPDFRLYTVGYYDPAGRWVSESDHDSTDKAAARVAFLNGSTDAQLRAALAELVTRCDGAEGVRADGSNIDTLGAHAALGDFNNQPEG